MRPMVLPYVDLTPTPTKMLQARAMVRQEAGLAEVGSGYSEKICALHNTQVICMEEYNAFRKEMQAVRQELLSLLFSQSINFRPLKRKRSSESAADCEMLRFEGLFTEALGLELLLHCWEGHTRECADARVVLEVLQNTQEFLQATKRRTEEVNALRCVEQRQCAKVLADKGRVAAKRLERIRVLRQLLRSGDGGYRSTLLASLD